MLVIKYPEPDFQIRKKGNKDEIFDSYRKRWVSLSPEEWVRQNFIRYLVSDKNYPSPLIAIEKEIMLGELKKRFDILVYDNKHQPWMMIECKAASIKLDQVVLEQVLRYNISIPVKYLIVTNGNDAFGWVRNEKGLELIVEIPEWAGESC